MNDVMTAVAYFKDGTEQKQRVANGCQVWKFSKGVFEARPDTVHIEVVDSSGSVLKDMVYVETKRGMVMKDTVRTKRSREPEVVKPAKKHGCIFITA